MYRNRVILFWHFLEIFLYHEWKSVFAVVLTLNAMTIVAWRHIIFQAHALMIGGIAETTLKIAILIVFAHSVDQWTYEKHWFSKCSHTYLHWTHKTTYISMPIESFLIDCVTWSSRLVYGRLSSTRTIEETFLTWTHAISSSANRFWRKRLYVRAIFCLYAWDVRICNRIGRFKNESTRVDELRYIFRA